MVSIRGTLGVSNILHVCDLCLEVVDTPPEVEEQPYDDGDEDEGDDDAGRHATVAGGLLLLLLPQWDVTVGPCECMTAHTAVHCVADEVLIFTFTRLHAMISIIAFRANFGAVLAHPAGSAVAGPVVAAALPAVLALAVLAAVHAVRVLRARQRAVGARPPRQAAAHSCNMMTVRTILAGALVQAVEAVRLDGAWMFTGEPNVTRPAHVLPSHVVTRTNTEYDLRALLLAAQAVEAELAGLRAVGALPAGGAHALPGLRVARAVVLAVARLRAVLPVAALLAPRLTAHTLPLGLADAAASLRVAADAVVVMALADLRAAVAKPAGVAAPLTHFPHVAGAARASSILWIASSTIQTAARLGTVLAIQLLIAGSVTLCTLPSWRADATTIFR